MKAVITTQKSNSVKAVLTEASTMKHSSIYVVPVSPYKMVTVPGERGDHLQQDGCSQVVKYVCLVLDSDLNPDTYLSCTLSFNFGDLYSPL